MAEGVFDPHLILRFKYDHSSEGDQSADEVWNSDVYELEPHEVLEIYKMEIIPPVKSTTGVIEKLKYVTLVIGGKEYETIHVNSLMLPADHPTNPAVAIPFGTPYLHRPLTGVLPDPVSGKCPKVRRGEKIRIRTVAGETIDTDYEIILYAARVKNEDKLREVIGTSAIPVAVTLNGETYSKPDVPIRLDTFDELPGGLRQEKPQIFPWLTWATNKAATTANQWYSFEPDQYVEEDWMDLSWNLVNKDEAYLVEYLAVIPHSNSKSARFYIEGRVTNPEYPTRPLPEYNYFPPPLYLDTSVNQSLKRTAVPRKIVPPILYHGVKGGIQVKDNGTSIPANGVIVEVWGTKFVLK